MERSGYSLDYGTSAGLWG